jgi:hypothetical protein
MNRKLTLRPADQPYTETPEDVAAYCARTTDQERLWNFLRHQAFVYQLQGIDYGRLKLARVWRKIPPVVNPDDAE